MDPLLRAYPPLTRALVDEALAFAADVDHAHGIETAFVDNDVELV